MKHLSLTFILLKGWHFVGQPAIRDNFLLFRLGIVSWFSAFSTSVLINSRAFFFFFLFLQLSKWTCRKLWLKPPRPAPKSAWYWATLTAAGCPRPWRSSRAPVATARRRPPSLPPSPARCPRLVFSQASPREPKLAWGSWMVATPWADPCPGRTNWTRGSIGRSSTTPWTDTAAVRRRSPSRSFPWQAFPPLSRPPEEATAPSCTSTSCERRRHVR